MYKETDFVISLSAPTFDPEHPAIWIPSLSDWTPSRNNRKNCNHTYQGPHPDATDGDLSRRGDAGPPQVY
nr:hypothetical protein HmN_000935000 [Hymenolepis microstoma]